MPLTSAQKSQRYRDKKIRTLGDKFRETENRKRRERRAKAKKPREEKQHTATQQEQSIARLYKYITGQEFKNDYSIFKNHVMIMKALVTNPEWKTPNTINKYLENLSSVLKNMNGYENAYMYYSMVSTEVRKRITEQDNNNKLSEAEKNNWVSQDTINKAYTRAGTAYDKALMAIYTLIPPRRRDLSVKLTLSNTKDFKKIKNKDDYNWLLVSAKGMPYKIVMYRYKTFKTYGVYTITLRGSIHKQLRNILKKHVQMNNIPQGGAVFYNNNGGYLEPSNMSKYIQKIFNDTIGKPISFNLLRHIRITEFYKTPTSINQKKELAFQMGHDVSTQAKYVRL